MKQMLVTRYSVRGFTLIETLIVTALVLIILSILALFFVKINATTLTEQTSQNVSGSSGVLLHELETNVRLASQVVASHTFSGTTYTTDAHTLVLQVPAVSYTGLAISGRSDYIAFYQSATSVYRVISSDPVSSRVAGTKMLTNALLSLTFTYDNADPTQSTKVSADIQTQATVRGATFTSHLHEQITLRNR